jgi:hypothetical protein
MLDPTTTRTNPLRNDRWGYTGELLEDPVMIEESSGPGRSLLWIALAAIAIVVVVALLGAAV